MTDSFHQMGKGILPHNMVSTFLKGSTVFDSKFEQKPDKNMITVYNAFNGLQLSVPYDFCNNLEGLKKYIAELFHIDPEWLFLLTPFGIKLKYSMITNQQVTELYAFDRKFFNPGLLNKDREDKILKDLINSLDNEDLISMVKPRDSPIGNTSTEINKFIDSFLEPNNKHISSIDLDFDKLRMCLSSLKRNSGWTSALLSDMKSTFANNLYHQNYLIIEHIIESINILVQYITNMKNDITKEMNTIFDIFKKLSSESLVSKWEDAFQLLQKVTISYVNQTNQRTMQLTLSNLMNFNKLEKSAAKSKVLTKKISSFLEELNTIIQDHIDEEIRGIIDTYQNFANSYLKPEWELSESGNIKRANQLYETLESIIGDMSNEMNNIPSFEQMIITTDEMSTNLSDGSINRILQLIEIYQRQELEYVPKITKIANDLYDIQSKYYTMRQELQTNIIKGPLISVVNVQLMVREASNLINNEILINIENMQEEELILSSVVDLPLNFGIWMVSVIHNKEYGKSIDEIILQTNRILENLKSTESASRSKWIEEFIKDREIGKFEFDYLTDSEKKKFVNYGLFEYQINRASENKSNNRVSYLTPINKFLQNMKGKEDGFGGINDITSYNGRELNDPITDVKTQFFIRFIQDINIDTALSYINQLKRQGYNSESISQLNDLIVDDNTASEYYNKNLFKFLKGYETKDIKVVKNKEMKNEVAESEKIKAYQLRIQRLEKQLHEKKFNKFQYKWSELRTDNYTTEEIENYANQEKYTNKNVKLPPSHYLEKMKRLEEENAAHVQKIGELEMLKDIEEMMNIRRILETKNKEIDKLKADAKVKNESIEMLKIEIENINSQNAKLIEEKKAGELKLENLEKFNKELLENMANKEGEIMIENQMNQKKKNDLEMRIEELVEVNSQYEKIVYKIEDIEKIIKDVFIILRNFIGKLNSMSKILYEDMNNFCLILEMMGLLLVQNESGNYEIQRVKGLRGSKRKIIGADDDNDKENVMDDEKLFIQVIATDIVNKCNVEWIEKKINDGKWSVDKKINLEQVTENIGDLKYVKLDDIDDSIESIDLFNNQIRSIVEQYDSHKTDENYKTFIDSIKIEPEMMLVSIHKRFEDVESLARKLQREKVQLKNEVKRLTKKNSQQLVINKFEKGDLVLFLRTSIGTDSNIGGEQPWAIFNMGSPNYYLRNGNDKLKEKEWFVGRILHKERRVAGEDENPFNLNSGVVWYWVDVEE